MQPPDPTQPVVGGIYSIVHSRETGEFGAAKVLAVDAQAVHVRSYANRYATRPAAIDPQTLNLGGGFTRMPDGSWGAPSGPMGIGHLPISHAQFAGWQPVYAGFAPVTDDELDGYREWRDSGGGVWG